MAVRRLGVGDHAQAFHETVLESNPKAGGIQETLGRIQWTWIASAHIRSHNIHPHSHGHPRARSPFQTLAGPEAAEEHGVAGVVPGW